MIAALPGAGGFGSIANDIQAVAPQVILVALLIGAFLYLLPWSRKLARFIFGGVVVFVFVTSGLALAWIDYLVSAFGGKA